VHKQIPASLLPHHANITFVELHQTWLFLQTSIDKPLICHPHISYFLGPSLGDNINASLFATHQITPKDSQLKIDHVFTMLSFIAWLLFLNQLWIIISVMLDILVVSISRMTQMQIIMCNITDFITIVTTWKRIVYIIMQGSIILVLSLTFVLNPI
jgi:hypothetical protein